MSSIRKSIVLGVVMLALPALASAQTARVEGMALQGDYIKDYTGIYTYTSGVSNVGNLVYGELGNTQLGTTSGAANDRGVGAVLGNLWDGRYGTWAIHLRQWTPQLGQGDQSSQPNPGALGFDPNTNANESFDIMWGRKMGTTSLGLRLNRSYYKSEDALAGITTTLKFDVPTAGINGFNTGRNILGFGGGIGFEMNPNTNVELSLLYQNRDYQKSTTGDTLFESDKSSNWVVSGRAMWQWMPNVMVTPVVKFYSFDLSTKTTPPGGASVKVDNTLSGWQVGAAGNWTIGSNDLFVLGASFVQNKLDTPALVTTEQLTPLVFAALETHVNNWLTFRMGASKGAYEKLKVEDNLATGETNINQSSFNMNLGTGVKLGTLQLDAVMDNMFPQTLGGWFSNAPGGFIAFPKVTATYAF